MHSHEGAGQESNLLVPMYSHLGSRVCFQSEFKNGLTKCWPELLRRSTAELQPRCQQARLVGFEPTTDGLQPWTPNRQSIRVSCEGLNEVLCRDIVPAAHQQGP
jgi:hypothetical protein